MAVSKIKNDRTYPYKNLIYKTPITRNSWIESSLSENIDDEALYLVNALYNGYAFATQIALGAWLKTGTASTPFILYMGNPNKVDADTFYFYCSTSKVNTYVGGNLAGNIGISIYRLSA